MTESKIALRRNSLPMNDYLPLPNFNDHLKLNSLHLHIPIPQELAIKFQGTAKLVGDAFLIAGVAASTVRIISAYCDKEKSVTREVASESIGWTGSLIGSFAGSKIGGLVGTFIAGPIGAVIGSIGFGFYGSMYGLSTAKNCDKKIMQYNDANLQNVI